MVINTNISALTAQNSLRMTSENLAVNIQRLSSGLRINRGADDPSGIAIANGMKAQMSGIQTAIQNVQDTLGLLQYADSMVGTITDIVIRLRDLCVRLGNQAVLSSNPTANPALPANPSDSHTIKNEMMDLMGELQRVTASSSYNGIQNLLLAAYSPGFINAQIGPDNSPNQQFNVVLPDLLPMLTSLTPVADPFDPMSNADAQVWQDYAMGILDDIEEKNPLVPPAGQFGLPKLLSARGDIGVQERVLSSVLNDLNSQYINMAAAKSRIEDADMAVEISDYTKNKILADSSTAILAQANVQPQLVLQLIDSIQKPAFGFG